MSVQEAVQTGVYSQLSAGLAETVYDHVPDNTQAIYVVIGNDTYIEWDTDGTLGYEATLTIHVWDNSSDQRGMKQVQRVQGEIYDLLHRQDFTVTDYDLIGCDYEFSETLLDPDGITRHGIQRFRLKLSTQ